MADTNLVIIVGHLTDAPEFKVLQPSGKAVANMRLAHNRRWKQGNEVKSQATFINVTIWDKQAETCRDYLRKGSKISVEGRLESRSWIDDATQQKRSIIEIQARSINFLDPKQKSDDSGGSSVPTPSSLDDEEVPF